MKNLCTMTGTCRFRRGLRSANLSLCVEHRTLAFQGIRILASPEKTLYACGKAEHCLICMHGGANPNRPQALAGPLQSDCMIDATQSGQREAIAWAHLRDVIVAGPVLSRALPSRVLGSHAAETQVASSLHELAALAQVYLIVLRS